MEGGLDPKRRNDFSFGLHTETKSKKKLSEVMYMVLGSS